jgi:hypothetical protein
MNIPSFHPNLYQIIPKCTDQYKKGYNAVKLKRKLERVLYILIIKNINKRNLLKSHAYQLI